MKIFIFLDAIGSWVKNSPKVLAIVSISSLFSFLIAGSNGYLSLVAKLEENARVPNVTISGITTTKREAITNMGQVLGTGTDYTMEGPISPETNPSTRMPFLNVKIQLLNPSKNATTFMRCVLKAWFADSSNFVSEGYVETAQYLSGERKTGNNQYFLRSGEAIEIDLMFFFLPTPKLQKVWSNKSNMLDIAHTSVSCVNEFGKHVPSQ